MTNISLTRYAIRRRAAQQLEPLGRLGVQVQEPVELGVGAGGVEELEEAQRHGGEARLDTLAARIRLATPLERVADSPFADIVRRDATVLAVQDLHFKRALSPMGTTRMTPTAATAPAGPGLDLSLPLSVHEVGRRKVWLPGMGIYV